MANSNLAILYGSQTGNAEDLAKRIGLQAKLRGHQVVVQTMDTYPLKLLPRQGMVVFVCSTTGHGQEPENMKNLYNFIRRRDLPKDCLNNLKFAVYGLGDSSYSKFNYVSKILYKRLKECGAIAVQELVCSDEQHPFGCDGLVYPKLNDFWNIFSEKSKTTDMDLKKASESITDRNSYNVELYTDNDNHSKLGSIFKDEFKFRHGIREAICIKNERITADDHFQDTRFLCFKDDEELNYEPGDVCTIYPRNLEENVQLFLKLLNLDSKQRFKLTKRDPNYMIDYLYDFIPDGLEIGDLIRYYFDIQSVPKRSFFEYLWPFSDDKLERDKLREFASTEGQEELYDYCIRPKRSILETLMDFPNTIKNIQFESLLDMIPPIKPRSFSIASSASLHPNEIHLLVGVVEYKTTMKKARRGLCSNYLAEMQPNSCVKTTNQQASGLDSSKLRYFVRQTAFRLPEDSTKPFIMVGPGLGLAPFRSFIEELWIKSRRLDKHVPDGGVRLYFGCRNSKKDFYFEQELQSYVDTNLLKLRVAFSRQERKKYVQDLLLEDSTIIRNLIQEQGATIYVAGNSKLPEELRTLIGKLISSPLGDQEQAADIERIVTDLEASNRLQYDCW